MENSKGFTLIELLIAIALTGVIISALLGAFVSFIGGHAVSQDRRDALESIRFALSDMQRELAFGTEYTCENDNCTCISFRDQIGRIVSFRHNADKNSIEKNIRSFGNSSSCSLDADVVEAFVWSPLTDVSTEIKSLVFETNTTNTTTIEQPRVKIKAEVEYEYQDEIQEVIAKTQVTRRIISPSNNILNLFRTGSDLSDTTSLSYFIYAEEEGELKCKDERGETFGEVDGTTVCDLPQIPIAAEFTEAGLYVLVENGLLFLIPQAEIDEIITATGEQRGTLDPNIILIPEVTVSSEDVEVKRVIGYDNGDDCRQCSSDPVGIKEIHPSKESLYAIRANGGLYQVISRATEPSIDNAALRYSGGIRRETIRHFDISSDESSPRVFTSLRDRSTNGFKWLISLYLDGTEYINDEDLEERLADTSCQRFSNVTNNRCSWLYSEKDGRNATDINPDQLEDILESTSLSFISRLQAVNGRLNIWYADNDGRYLASVGETTGDFVKVDYDAGDEDSDESLVVASGNNKGFVHYEEGGEDNYVFSCKNGSSLCRVESLKQTDIRDLKETALTGQGNDRGKIIDHEHFEDNNIGISSNGRIIYFDDFSIDNGDREADLIEVFDSRDRVLCNVNAFDGSAGDGNNELDQQVSFEYISEEHPTQEIVAAIGKVFYTGEDSASFEIFLLVPTVSGKVQTGCPDGSLTYNIERYDLPAVNGLDLDILRLPKVEFRDKI